MRGEGILDSSKENIFENNFIECPYCDCKFGSQIDLESHLEVFGINKYEHIQKLDNAHKSVDRTYVRGSLSKDSKKASKPDKSRFYRY